MGVTHHGHHFPRRTHGVPDRRQILACRLEQELAGRSGPDGGPVVLPGPGQRQPGDRRSHRLWHQPGPCGRQRHHYHHGGYRCHLGQHQRHHVHRHHTRQRALHRGHAAVWHRRAGGYLHHGAGHRHGREQRRHLHGQPDADRHQPDHHRHRLPQRHLPRWQRQPGREEHPQRLGVQRSGHHSACGLHAG